MQKKIQTSDCMDFLEWRGWCYTVGHQGNHTFNKCRGVIRNGSSRIKDSYHYVHLHTYTHIDKQWHFWSRHFKWLYLAIKWEHYQSSQLNSGLIRSDRMNVSFFFRDWASKWCSKSISEVFNICFNEGQLTY